MVQSKQDQKKQKEISDLDQEFHSRSKNINHSFQNCFNIICVDYLNTIIQKGVAIKMSFYKIRNEITKFYRHKVSADNLLYINNLVKTDNDGNVDFYNLVNVFIKLCKEQYSMELMMNLIFIHVKLNLSKEDGSCYNFILKTTTSYDRK